MLPLAPTLETSPGLCSFAGSDIGLKLTDLNSAVVQAGSSWLLVLLHLDGDMVGTGRAQGQLRGLSHALHTAILLSCHNLLEAHWLGFAGRQFLGRETGLGSSRRDGGETLRTTEQAKGWEPGDQFSSMCCGSLAGHRDSLGSRSKLSCLLLGLS